MKGALDKLCKKLGYTFKDFTYLDMALTHRSRSSANNERLEFLGDSLLNFCIAQKLFQTYPDLDEGGLSRLRANLVNGDVLAEIAQEFRVSDYLRLGAGEIKSGGVLRKSILANVVEAIIGAIYLDSDVNICQQKILTWYAARLKAITVKGVTKDPKTQLQEFAQAKKMPLPKYVLVATEGKDHNQRFRIECQVPGWTFSAIGEGTSRRRAEQDAAEKFLLLAKNGK